MWPSQEEMDECQLAPTASNESATAMALPAPAASTHIVGYVPEKGAH
jgi:hypothetical protein